MQGTVTSISRGFDGWPTTTWSVGCLSLIRWIKFVAAISPGSSDDTHSLVRHSTEQRTGWSWSMVICVDR
jgi:hypothetical protein